MAHCACTPHRIESNDATRSRRGPDDDDTTNTTRTQVQPQTPTINGNPSLGIREKTQRENTDRKHTDRKHTERKHRDKTETENTERKHRQKYDTTLQSTTLYDSILQSTTCYDSVLQSTTQHSASEPGIEPRNICHCPNSPNTTPATKHDRPKSQRNFLKTDETSFTMRGRSENDPTMIRA